MLFQQSAELVIAQPEKLCGYSLFELCALEREAQDIVLKCVDCGAKIAR
jgi:hypothetical protein